MKDLTDKRQAFVIAIEDSTNKKTYNSPLESAREAGYKGNDNTLSQTAHKLVRNGKVEQARQAIRAEKQVETEHNYEIAVFELNQVIANLTTQAKSGNIQANQALTGAIREKNAITGLHKQTIQHKGEPMPERSEAEQQAITGLARQYKLKIAEG